MFNQRWPIFIGITLFILIFLYSFSERTHLSSTFFPEPPPPPLPIIVPATESEDWSFQVARDGLNLGLSDQQCTVLSPKLLSPFMYISCS